MSRTLIAAALPLAGLLLLGGCASLGPGDDSAAAEVSAQSVVRYRAPAPAKSAPLTWAESRYVETVREITASVPHEEFTDAELIEGGKKVCSDIRGGATWSEWSKWLLP